MIQIVADTLASIPVSEAKQLNLPYLPQIVIFGEQSLRDDTEITSEAFLERLKTSKEFPKTAAPPPVLYNPIYEELLKVGEPILVVCPSSKVSGTVRSAEVAAQDFPNGKIHVIDTLLVGAALGTVVKEALKLAKAGKDINSIIQKITSMAKRNRTYFLLDTLEYLHKGGRIGAAKALVGGLLQVKPILSFKNGQVEPLESQRTNTKAFNRLIEIVNSECPHSEESFLYVQQGGAMDLANQLVLEFSKSLGIKNIPIVTVPPAILAYGGPRVCGVSFFVK